MLGTRHARKLKVVDDFPTQQVAERNREHREFEREGRAVEKEKGRVKYIQASKPGALYYANTRTLQCSTYLHFDAQRHQHLHGFQIGLIVRSLGRIDRLHFGH